IEQHAVANPHLAHEIARLVVAHAGPRLGADAREVIDRERVGLGLHQPVFHAGHYRPNERQPCSVTTPSRPTSQLCAGTSATSWQAKPTPTSQGPVGAPSRRKANARS